MTAHLTSLPCDEDPAAGVENPHRTSLTTFLHLNPSTAITATRRGPSKPVELLLSDLDRFHRGTEVRLFLGDEEVTRLIQALHTVYPPVVS